MILVNFQQKNFMPEVQMPKVFPYYFLQYLQDTRTNDFLKIICEAQKLKAQNLLVFIIALFRFCAFLG